MWIISEKVEVNKRKSGSCYTLFELSKSDGNKERLIYSFEDTNKLIVQVVQPSMLLLLILNKLLLKLLLSIRNRSLEMGVKVNT